MKSILKLLLLVVFMIAANSTQAQVKKKIVKKTVVKPGVKKQTTKIIKIAPSAIIDKSIKIKITTDSGVIVVKLYDSTPLHRDNFAKLVSEKFYDSLIFHRVISNFMIQGGDPQSKTAVPGQMLGNGGGDMARIPAEFNNKLIHKKGALCAARDNNPEKASSACQFYIVQGKKYTKNELFNIEQQHNYKFTKNQLDAYSSIGGTPLLDIYGYTVFGEVIEGIYIIEKIAKTITDVQDRPLKDIRMKIEFK